MSETIKVSVIMPVYNARRFLKQSLDSVIAQSLKEIEVICVDDGSTDDSLQILRSYENRYPFFHVLTQSNLYAGRARNAGLAQAKGKYVVFWDSDDIFGKQALELMYRKCEREQSDVCVCDAFRLDDTTGVRSSQGIYLVKEQLKKAVSQPFSKKDIPAYIFTFTNNAPWNKMYRRRFLKEKKIVFQPLVQANDLFFVMCAFYFADRISVVDRPLLTYRMGNNESLTGRASRYADCARQALDGVWDVLQENREDDSRILQSFANKAWFVLLASLRQQSSVEEYKTLYGLYKTQLLEKYGITGHGSDYIFHEGRSKALAQMTACEYDQFLLYEMRCFERESRLSEWRVKASLSFRTGNAIVAPLGRIAGRLKK